MLHYIVILMPQADNAWRALFPDFPECHADGESIAYAVGQARNAVYHRMEELGRNGDMRFPRSLEAILDDPDWGMMHGVDWYHAIISLVPFPNVASSVVFGHGLANGEACGRAAGSGRAA